MEERRAVGEALRRGRGPSDQIDADETESEAKAKSKLLHRYSFKKVADIPLGTMIERKMMRRAKREKGNITV